MKNKNKTTFIITATIFSALFSSCGPRVPKNLCNHKVTKIDSDSLDHELERRPRAEYGEFAKYKQDFERYGKRFRRDPDFNAANVRIVFNNGQFEEGSASSKSTIGGMCSRGSDGRHTIYINRSLWGRISDNYRRMIIFHELGHCRLNRGHSNKLDDNGAQKSLMHEHLFISESYFAKREEQYIEELFRPYNY